MTPTANELIKIAESQIGYLEKRTNSQLDSKTANAGSANWTKYGAWYGLNPAAWCAMFVSWCFGEAAGSKKGAQDMLCGFLWASCTRMYNAFKQAGRVYKSPAPGDIIVFNSSAGSATMAHTGIVTKVSGGRVYTVEGNTSTLSGVIANGGGVAAKNYSLTYSRIGGYLRPPYAVKAADKYVSIQAQEIKQGSTGAAVTGLQAVLNGLGYNCGTVDGDFGAKTDAALRAFQKAKNLTVDGECGKNSWAALIGGKV